MPRDRRLPAHVPTMSDAEVARIERWHERAYQAACTEGAETQTFAYLDRTIVVPPRVQPITPVSHLLGEAVLSEVDMGTGSGVNAILAAGTARDVVAVDINPHALAAARANAARNGVQARIDVRESDVFDDVEGSFDLMIFDPPFRWFAPRDIFEAATTDENYTAMTTFFRGARSRLSARGRMLIFFGSSGDIDYLTKLMEAEGFDREVVATQDLEKEGHHVAYFTFRVTPRS